MESEVIYFHLLEDPYGRKPLALGRSTWHPFSTMFFVAGDLSSPSEHPGTLGNLSVSAALGHLAVKYSMD